MKLSKNQRKEINYTASQSNELILYIALNNLV